MENEIRKVSEDDKTGKMRKRWTELSDGRYLIYFSFDDLEETNNIKQESADKKTFDKGD